MNNYELTEEAVRLLRVNELKYELAERNIAIGSQVNKIGLTNLLLTHRVTNYEITSTRNAYATEVEDLLDSYRYIGKIISVNNGNIPHRSCAKVYAIAEHILNRISRIHDPLTREMTDMQSELTELLTKIAAHNLSVANIEEDELEHTVMRYQKVQNTACKIEPQGKNDFLFENNFQRRSNLDNHACPIPSELDEKYLSILYDFERQNPFSNKPSNKPVAPRNCRFNSHNSFAQVNMQNNIGNEFALFANNHNHENPEHTRDQITALTLALIKLTQTKPGLPVNQWNLRFSGNPKFDKYSITEFLSRIEEMSASEHITEIELMRKIHFLLNGKAYTWFQSARPYINTFDEFTEALKARYSDDYAPLAERVEVGNRKQVVNENTLEYIESMILAFSHLKTEEAFSTYEQMQILLNGLCPEARSTAFLYQAKSVYGLRNLIETILGRFHKMTKNNASNPSKYFSTSMIDAQAQIENNENHEGDENSKNGDESNEHSRSFDFNL